MRVHPENVGIVADLNLATGGFLKSGVSIDRQLESVATLDPRWLLRAEGQTYGGHYGQSISLQSCGTADRPGVGPLSNEPHNRELQGDASATRLSREQRELAVLYGGLSAGQDASVIDALYQGDI